MAGCVGCLILPLPVVLLVVASVWFHSLRSTVLVVCEPWGRMVVYVWVRPGVARVVVLCQSCLWVDLVGVWLLWVCRAYPVGLCLHMVVTHIRLVSGLQRVLFGVVGVLPVVVCVFVLPRAVGLCTEVIPPVDNPILL